MFQGIPDHLVRTEAPAARAPAEGAATGVQQTTPAPQAAAETTNTDNENVNLFEAAAAAARSGGARGGAPAGNPAGNQAGLEFLRNNPQFLQLRRLVQESPAMLEPILQQVGQGNPQLAALISQNPEAFLALLSEAGDEDSDGHTTIQVSEEEADAINRVCFACNE